jgi:hypothetical protein
LRKIIESRNNIFALNSNNEYLALLLYYLAIFLCLVGGLVIVLALRKFFSRGAIILFLSPFLAIWAPAIIVGISNRTGLIQLPFWLKYGDEFWFILYFILDLIIAIKLFLEAKRFFSLKPEETEA